VRALAFATALVLGTGCGEQTAPDPEDGAETGAGAGTGAGAEPGIDTSPTPTTDLSAIPDGRAARLASPLDEEIRHTDPALAGWETEQLEAAAGRRLETLGQWLTQQDGSDEDALGDWLVDDVRITPLRPAAPDLSQHGSLQVARAEQHQLRTPELGVEQALLDLAAPYTKGPELHWKTKTISVEPGADRRFTTRVLVQLWGPDGSGVRQTNSTWMVMWHWPSADAEASLIGLTGERFSEVTAPAPLFSDCTEAVLGDTLAWQEQLRRGADDWCARIDLAAQMNQYGHNGLTIGDFDEDGLEDLYVLQSGGLPNRLFLQQPDGTVRDASEDFGLDWLEESRAALLLDLDNDGRDELVISFRTGVHVMRRDRDGRFQPATKLGIDGGYSIAAADYDGDGLLDLYVCNYTLAVGESSLPTPYHDARNGPPNGLFRNQGGLRFQNVSQSTGLNADNRRFSFAANWVDYDEDGDPDLYVANDFGRNNLYRNDGGRFTDVAAEAGVEDQAAGMGVSWSDYDEDGDLDLYVSNMFSSAGRRIAYQRQFREDEGEAAREAFLRHARGNSLFANQGDGAFVDVTEASDTWMGRWAWGSEFVDVDNDGREDICVPNGFFTNEDTGDL